jgi:hypothetical protein
MLISNLVAIVKAKLTPQRMNVFILILGLIPFGYWLLSYINIDLWYDEVYSLKNYVLKDWSVTTLEYTLPNNHIFFNLIQQSFTRVLNYRTMVEVAEHAYLFRVFQGIVTVLIALYSYLILKKHLKLNYSSFVIVLLFTCIPFLNFSLQLRGYNLSSLLLLMILYHVLELLENGGRNQKIIIVLATAALIYTIPSNFYFIAAGLVPIGIGWVINLKYKGAKTRNYFYAALFICVGLAIAFALYYPILDGVLHNRFSERKPGDIYYSLKLMNPVFSAFLSALYC